MIDKHKKEINEFIQARRNVWKLSWAITQYRGRRKGSRGEGFQYEIKSCCKEPMWLANRFSSHDEWFWSCTSIFCTQVGLSNVDKHDFPYPTGCFAEEAKPAFARFQNLVITSSMRFSRLPMQSSLRWSCSSTRRRSAMRTSRLARARRAFRRRSWLSSLGECFEMGTGRWRHGEDGGDCGVELMLCGSLGELLAEEVFMMGGECFGSGAVLIFEKGSGSFRYVGSITGRERVRMSMGSIASSDETELGGGCVCVSVWACVRCAGVWVCECDCRCVYVKKVKWESKGSERGWFDRLVGVGEMRWVGLFIGRGEGHANG